VSTPRGIPTPNERNRQRDYIAGLEEEIVRLRQSLAEAEQRSANDLRPGGDNYYKEVFDHLSVCMFFIDVTPDGRFRYAGFNPAEEKLWVIHRTSTGKFVEEYSQRTLPKAHRNYRLCVEAGKPITYDDELICQPGAGTFIPTSSAHR
jgi:hypothetical protein